MQPALYPGLLMLVLAWGSSSFLAIASTETTQPETNVLFRRFHSTKSDVNEVHMRKTPLLALLTLPVAPKRHAPITTVPQCDLYDGYFYVTPQNYTWQLQCTTNYEGNIVSEGDTADFGQCISTCAAYNQATLPGACLAVTFNGPNNGAVGMCTLWSDIFNVLLAYEEGSKHPQFLDYILQSNLTQGASLAFHQG